LVFVCGTVSFQAPSPTMDVKSVFRLHEKSWGTRGIVLVFCRDFFFFEVKAKRDPNERRIYSRARQGRGGRAGWRQGVELWKGGKPTKTKQKFPTPLPLYIYTHTIFMSDPSPILSLITRFILYLCVFSFAKYYIPIYIYGSFRWGCYRSLCSFGRKPLGVGAQRKLVMFGIWVGWLDI